MADQINAYSVIISGACSQIGKAHKREFYEGRRAAVPKILELLEQGVPESTIARETNMSIDFVKQVKWKNESEKRDNSFESKLYELSRHKNYQKNSARCKPIGLNVCALLREFGDTNKRQRNIINAIKKMDLEQLVENQIRENFVGAVFSKEYYKIKTQEIDYKKIAKKVDTWPCIIKRLVNELNIKKYLAFAFGKAQEYGLSPQQIGTLLVYSDEGVGKDPHCGYNYIRLAKQTGLPFDSVVKVLKHKSSMEISGST